ncbi:MAG: hypothetical protein AAF432_12280 [Planctomycetota bacterium]
MRQTCAMVGLALLTGIAGGAGTESLNADVRNDRATTASGGGVTGPDVIVGQVGLDPGDFFGSFVNYPSANGYRSYAVNTTSCNVGDAPLSWRDGTLEMPDKRHPVIAQNMYRYADGRIEMVGMSWLKHGFCATTFDLCGTCNVPLDCDFLFPGCSDPYSAGTNGNNQSRLGPRYEVNALTGDFPFPADTESAPVSDSTYRRLRVAEQYVEAASNPNATWFVEVQYIAADDAAAGNDLNNASYRKAMLDTDGSLLNFDGPTVQELPAIMAWPTLDPNATVVAVDVPGEGRLHLGYAAHDLGDGRWAYEYAIHNLNSDRAAGGLRVPVSEDTCITEIGFHDVEYIAGEPYDDTDWSTSQMAGELRWASASFATDPNANAVRWGTMYNYRFIANAPPIVTPVTIEIFKPGATNEMTVMAIAPQTPCAADCAPSGGNGTVNIDDLIAAINEFGMTESDCDITPVNADCTTGNAIVNIDDVIATINAFGPCP